MCTYIQLLGCDSTCIILHVHVHTYSCSGVKIHGVLYRCGSVIRMTSSDNTDDLSFTYAQIKKVYVHLDYKIFVTYITAREFMQPLRSLNVVTEQPLLCLSTHLYCHGVHLKHHNLYLVEKDYWLKHSVFY